MPFETVRPRAAASLIILRAGAHGPEVLMGCRSRSARFMPGRYVFPGGAVQRSDYRPWLGEETPAAGPSERTGRALARAGIRETFEETGLLVGVPAAPCERPPARLSDLERALLAQALAPGIDRLRVIGRAITPTRSPVRFHARFFLVDAAHVFGTPAAGTELENVAFYPVADPPSPISDVTAFMLRRAIAVYGGESTETVPLYAYVADAPRLRWKATSILLPTG